jgi:hypothetical protein
LGLCGDSGQADVIRIDLKSTSTQIEFSVPTWQDLKGVQSGADLDALVVPDQNPMIAHLRDSLWVPPLVSSNILEAKSLTPSDLIPLLSAKFQFMAAIRWVSLHGDIAE